MVTITKSAIKPTLIHAAHHKHHGTASYCGK